MYFPKWTQHQHDQPDLVILKHRTGPRSSPLQVLYLVLKLKHIQLQKVSFVSSLMQANVIHSILSAGSEGNSRACTAHAMGAEHAPSATAMYLDGMAMLASTMYIELLCCTSRFVYIIDKHD